MNTAQHVVTFTPTSSTELDSLLNTVREQRIMPMYLSPQERKKIYRERDIQKLKNDPPTVTIDGEVHKFTYTDRHKDLADVRKTTMGAIKLMKTSEDWANLSRLLVGLHHMAKMQWWDNDKGDRAKLARRAGSQDRIFTIIECARQVADTGFKLDDPELIAEIMYWVQWKAFAGFEASSFADVAATAAKRKPWPDAGLTRKALRWADMVVELLQLPEHEPAEGLHSQPSGFALRDDPKWIVPQLHLAAALVVKHKLPEEEIEAARKRVTQLASTLVKRWPAGKGLQSMQAPKDPSDKSLLYAKHPNRIVREGALAVSALDLAMASVEPELAAELKSRRDPTSAEVNDLLAQGPDKQRTGRLVYDILFGTNHILPPSEK